MESTEKSGTSPKSEAAPPPPPPTSPCRVNYFVVDVVLRVLLFAASVVAVVVIVTNKQTEVVLRPGTLSGPRFPRSTKFYHSPAYIYFVAALSVAVLYSIITTLASLSVIWKPAFSKQFLLYVALWDVLLLGVVASATGTAGGVAYIQLKGNKHVGWGKVCNVYDKFCDHVVSSLAMSLFASILLFVLSALSIFALYKRIRD